MFILFKAFVREVFNRVPEDLGALHEVFCLHSFMRIVRAVLVGDKDHRGGDAEAAECDCVVTGAGRQLFGFESGFSSRLGEMLSERLMDGRAVCSRSVRRTQI